MLKELMRGVERAQNVTINALRVSVTVADALYNQKVVLKKIEMLNETTNNIIASNARALKDQGAEIQRGSMKTDISVDKLKAAFTDAMEALDSISTYKQEALPKMRDTINQFKELASRGEEQIEKLEMGQKLGL
jgi:uncharacterized protein YaaN involved in tellurite resistance